MNAPLLSIVITTRNRYKDLSDCLASIKASEAITFDVETLIVDDASTDETANNSFRSNGLGQVHILRNQAQQMMVKTRNRGGREARGEFVLFIDDDNIVHPRMIAELVKFAQLHPEIGIVGPQMCYHPSLRPYMHHQEISLLTGKTYGNLAQKNFEFLESDGVPNVFMVRKKVLELCNYFDEDIVQTYTEPDLSFASRKLGYQTAMISKAITYHRIPEETSAFQLGGNQFRQKAFFLMRNRTVMVMRYAKTWQKFLYLLLFSWVWPLVYSIIVLRESRWDLVPLYFKGFVAGLKYAFTKKLPPANEVISNLKKAGV